MNLHQTVLHSLSSLSVDTVLATGCEEITLLDLIGPDTLSDTDHPEEFVDIVTRVAQEGTKDDENIVNLVLSHDRIANFFP